MDIQEGKWYLMEEGWMPSPESSEGMFFHRAERSIVLVLETEKIDGWAAEEYHLTLFDTKMGTILYDYINFGSLDFLQYVEKEIC